MSAILKIDERTIYSEVWPVWMNGKDFQKVAIYCMEYMMESGTWDHREAAEMAPEWIIKTNWENIDLSDPDVISFNYNRLNVYIELVIKYHLDITQRQLDNIPVRITEVFYNVMKDTRFYSRLLSIMWDCIRTPLTH